MGQAYVRFLGVAHISLYFDIKTTLYSRRSFWAGHGLFLLCVHSEVYNATFDTEQLIINMKPSDKKQSSEEPEKAPFSFSSTEAQPQLEFTLKSLIKTYGRERVLKTIEGIK